MTAGEILKDEGMERVARNVTLAPWRAVADAELLRLAASGRRFTSEDVTAVAGQPSHPNAVGALLNAAARQGLIVRVGYVQARRPNQHATMISQWSGTIRAVERYQPPENEQRALWGDR